MNERKYEKGQVVYRAGIFDVPISIEDRVEKLEVHEYIVTTRGEHMTGVRRRFLHKGKPALGIEDKGRWGCIERRYQATRHEALEAFKSQQRAEIADLKRRIKTCEEILHLADQYHLEER
jgi:hypothetical protein